MARASLRDARRLCRLPDGLAIREEVEDLTPEPVTTDPSFLDDAVLEPVGDEGQKALPTTGSSPVANGPPVAIGPPSEEALPGIVIDKEKPKEVIEVQVPQQGANTVEAHEAPKGQVPERTNPEAQERANVETPEIPLIEIHKPISAKKANRVRTRESLTTAFNELATVATCAQFRRKNSTTINQLRTNAKDEWDVFNEVAATHERTLFERENPQHAARDEHPADV